MARYPLRKCATRACKARAGAEAELIKSPHRDPEHQKHPHDGAGADAAIKGEYPKLLEFANVTKWSGDVARFTRIAGVSFLSLNNTVRGAMRGVLGGILQQLVGEDNVREQRSATVILPLAALVQYLKQPSAAARTAVSLEAAAEVAATAREAEAEAKAEPLRAALQEAMLGVAPAGRYVEPLSLILSFDWFHGVQRLLLVPCPEVERLTSKLLCLFMWHVAQPKTGNGRQAKVTRVMAAVLVQQGGESCWKPLPIVV